MKLYSLVYLLLSLVITQIHASAPASQAQAASAAAAAQPKPQYEAPLNYSDTDTDDNCNSSQDEFEEMLDIKRKPYAECQRGEYKPTKFKALREKLHDTLKKDPSIIQSKGKGDTTVPIMAMLLNSTQEQNERIFSLLPKNYDLNATDKYCDGASAMDWALANNHRSSVHALKELISRQACPAIFSVQERKKWSDGLQSNLRNLQQRNADRREIRCKEKFIALATEKIKLLDAAEQAKKAEASKTQADQEDIRWQ